VQFCAVTLAVALAIGLVQRGKAVHLSTTDPAAHLTMTLGGDLPGLRVDRIDPRVETERYVERIILRLTLAGAIYVTLVCLLPEFLILKWNVPFYFGGTSLLIIVVVTMDFMAQVQAYVMTHQYESLLRKANFKGGLPVR